MAKSQVRLLPVIGIFAACAFAIKAVSIAEAAGEATANAQAASAQAQQAQQNQPVPAPETTEPTAPAESETCPAPDLLAEQAGLSQYEIQVLRSLSERRERLEAREATLDTREMTISAAEARLDDQIAELERLENSIAGLLNTLDEQNEAQLASLVTIYESMRSDDAARIFNTLDDGLMLELAHRMKPAPMAAILADMDQDRARTLTTLMATRSEPPETLADLEARTNAP